MRNTEDAKNASMKMAMGINLPMPIIKNRLSIGLGRKHRKIRIWNKFTAHTATAKITKSKIVIMLQNQNVRSVNGSDMKPRTAASKRKHRNLGKIKII